VELKRYQCRAASCMHSNYEIVLATDYDLLARERDALRAMNLRLRDKRLELANNCGLCRGTGVAHQTMTGLPRGLLAGRGRPCPDCKDLRELLQ
jgi:hypothetical protein